MGPALVATDGARVVSFGLLISLTAYSLIEFRTAGDFAASKLLGSSDICIHSVVCPSAAPLRLQSAKVLPHAKCILVAKVAMKHADTALSSYLFAPGNCGIVAFDLIRTFGAASLPDGQYAPTVLSLPDSTLSYSDLCSLRVTECGKFMAVLAGAVACIMRLPGTLVRCLRPRVLQPHMNPLSITRHV